MGMIFLGGGDEKREQEEKKSASGNGCKWNAAVVALSGFALLADVCGWNPWGWSAAWVAVVLCGVPIVWEAAVGFCGSLNVKAGFLVALALGASLALDETFAAGEVAFIMKLGSLLEEWAVARARSGLETITELTPLTARVVDKNDDERNVPVEEVAVGARVRVLPGETVPLDGEIIFGATSVDQSVATGESLPVDKTVGDKVLSGTLNLFGAIETTVEKSPPTVRFSGRFVGRARSTSGKRGLFVSPTVGRLTSSERWRSRSAFGGRPATSRGRRPF